MVKFKYAGKKLFIMSVVSIKYVAYCMLNIWLEMDQRELESELQNMMKLHAEGVKQVKKMERIVRESDQRAKVSSTYDFSQKMHIVQPFSFPISWSLPEFSIFLIVQNFIQFSRMPRLTLDVLWN